MSTAHFAAEVMQRFLRETAFDIAARIDPRRPMALEINLVAALRGVLAMQKVVEGDFIEGGRRGKGGNMSADALDAACWP